MNQSFKACVSTREQGWRLHHQGHLQTKLSKGFPVEAEHHWAAAELWEPSVLFSPQAEWTAPRLVPRPTRLRWKVRPGLCRPRRVDKCWHASCWGLSLGLAARWTYVTAALRGHNTLNNSFSLERTRCLWPAAAPLLPLRDTEMCLRLSHWTVSVHNSWEFDKELKAALSQTQSRWQRERERWCRGSWVHQAEELKEGEGNYKCAALRGWETQGDRHKEWMKEGEPENSKCSLLPPGGGAGCHSQHILDGLSHGAELSLKLLPHREDVTVFITGMQQYVSCDDSSPSKSFYSSHRGAELRGNCRARHSLSTSLQKVSCLENATWRISSRCFQHSSSSGPAAASFIQDISASIWFVYRFKFET